jgi:hypothetical protein
MTSPGLTTTIDDITGTCKNMGRGEPEGNITQNIGPDGPSSYLDSGFLPKSRRQQYRNWENAYCSTLIAEFINLK